MNNLSIPAWISCQPPDIPAMELTEPPEHAPSDLNITVIEELLPFLDGRRYKVAHGGRGCIHEDTMIDTPDGQVKVSEFEGGSVLSLSKHGVVVAQALKPVRYPTTPMFLVTFDNGYSIKVTAAHRFLTETAWKQCHEVEIGRDRVSVASLPLTSQDIFPSRSAAGVQHYTRIVLNYLYGYLMGRRLCDEQPHQQSDTYQDILPSLSDVAEHTNHTSTRLDDQESVRIHNLVYRLLCHLSNHDALPSGEGKDYALMGNDISPRISESFSRLLQLCRLSRQKSSLDELVRELSDFFRCISEASETHLTQNLSVVQQLLQHDVGDKTYSDSLVNSVSLPYTTATSIEQVEDAEYYDLFVPQYNNYLTDGIVNHNSSKSWGIARMLIARAYSNRERILCCRELQTSIEESVLTLLENQISLLGLTKAFEIQAKKITCLTTGSVFLFEGLKSNVTKIRSMEGITLVWAEEAEKISKTSWDVLIPTIRTPNSEIWISFNPDDDLDETWLRFVEDPPPDTYVTQINYHANPWFPDVLRKEMEYCRNRSEDDYEHIWLGKPRKAMLGAYYAEEMTAAAMEGRIGNVPHDPAMPVQVSFDLGMADSMVLWFAQRSGPAVHIIDCWEFKGTRLEIIIKKMIDSDYIISQVILPHDGRVRGMISGLRRIDHVRSFGFEVTEAPSIHDGVGVDDGIRTVKSFLPRCYFDKAKCQDGIKALKRYRTKYNEARKVFDNKPLHDWCSDFADSFRYLAITAPRVEFGSWDTEISYNEASKHI